MKRIEKYIESPTYWALLWFAIMAFCLMWWGRWFSFIVGAALFLTAFAALLLAVRADARRKLLSDAEGPAGVCMDCRRVFRVGTFPYSHGLCADCDRLRKIEWESLKLTIRSTPRQAGTSIPFTAHAPRIIPVPEMIFRSGQPAEIKYRSPQ